MLSERLKASGPLAVAAIAVSAAGLAQSAMPAPRKGNGYRPAAAGRHRTALAREIAEHNAEVDRLKAEKRAEKRARRRATGLPASA